VSLIDVMPTLLNLAGVEQRLNDMQGTDLGPLLNGAVATEDSFSFASALPSKQTATIAVQDSKLKLILDLENGDHQLFDLTQDPGELHDIAAERVEDLDRMKSRVKFHLDAVREYPAYRATPAPLSEEDIERLRSLGYVG
jgi:arylsulfatase A-like enzyme